MKVHLTTLGCPKNQVDSELMAGMLARAGVGLAERAEDAECLVVNTCAFIDRAREESVRTILELARLKGRGRCRALVVTGCLTQRYGADILREMPEVDGVLGTSGLERIVDLVRQTANRHDWASAAPPGYLYDAGTPRLVTARVPYAYVKIAEGCDMGCTFCAIPQFRGRHRSRPLADIVREVQGLAAAGVQEAILVSQDTLAYGRDLPGNGDIGDLLLALGDETRMPWIRPMYLHPAHVGDRLVERWAGARVVPYLDLPVQHADDAILKAMRRAVTATRMQAIVATFRAAVPDVTVRTTVLVGFPGETDEDFARTLSLVREVEFDGAFTFRFSPREGTPATRMPDAVPDAVAAERLEALIAVVREVGRARAAAVVGTTHEVLVEEQGRKDGQLVGRTRHNRVALFDGPPSWIGTYRTVRLTGTTGATFSAAPAAVPLAVLGEGGVAG